MGTVNETKVLISPRTVVLPDKQYNTSTLYETNPYGSQIIPLCLAGSEPNLASDGKYICSYCAVGKYKATPGSYLCKNCPEGGDCNDVGNYINSVSFYRFLKFLLLGVQVPCTLKGYWYLYIESYLLHFI